MSFQKTNGNEKKTNSTRLLQSFFESLEGKVIPDACELRDLDRVVEVLFLPQFISDRVFNRLIEFDASAAWAYENIYRYQRAWKTSETRVFKDFVNTEKAFYEVKRAIWFQRYAFFKAIQELGIMPEFSKEFSKRIRDKKRYDRGRKRSDFYQLYDDESRMTPIEIQKGVDVFIKKALKIISASPKVKKAFEERFFKGVPSETAIQAEPFRFIEFADEYKIGKKIRKALKRHVDIDISCGIAPSFPPELRRGGSPVVEKKGKRLRNIL